MAMTLVAMMVSDFWKSMRIAYKRVTISPFKFPCTFSEEIILSVNVNHAVFENALPLVLDSGDLVICAENDISLA